MSLSLFKFVPNPSEMFADGYIRVTQPCALNDPFEAYIHDHMLETTLLRWNESRGLNVCPSDVGVFSENLREVVRNIGVISMTSNNNNLLMWAHYANNHKGVSVEFDIGCSEGIFASVFPISNCPDFLFKRSGFFNGRFEAVDYSEKLMFSDFSLLDSINLVEGNFLEKIVNGVFLRKNADWKNEEEYRAIFHLGQADRVIIKEKALQEPFVSGFIDDLPARFSGARIDNWHAVYFKNKFNDHVFDLRNIENSISRAVFASNLTRLSSCPSVIFLMKLRSGVVKSINFGLFHNCIESISFHQLDICDAGVDLLSARLSSAGYGIDFFKV